MKFSSIITTVIITASSTNNNVDAFSLQRANIMAINKASSAHGRSSSFSNSKMFLLAEDTNNEEGEEIASMIGSDNEKSLGSVYDRLGFAEENIAMGIDPDTVLEWIGNRDDMIARFKKDNEGLQDEQAQKEVDKFMMDQEMVNRLIRYEQMKANGEISPDVGPQFDWFTLLVGGYLVYVVSSIVKKSLDNRNALPAVDTDVAAAGVTDAVQGAIEAVQTSVDVAQNTVLESVHGTVPDIVQSTIAIAHGLL